MRCFNPRTREGATQPADYAQIVSVVFQSTHPRGCDHWRLYVLHMRAGFNPRTREGATHELERGFDGGAVSIHAPARVRRPGRCPRRCAHGFQSTHPRGCDPARAKTCGRWLFQSTHPRGCDHSDVGIDHPPQSFNPRTREGATNGLDADKLDGKVSIHAPARVRPA